MGSTLKFTEEIDSVYISSDVDYIIRTDYLEYSDQIIEALSYIPSCNSGSVRTYAFVAKGDKDAFFLIAVYYDSDINVMLDGIKKISLDEFLEHVSNDQYLKYGI